MACASAAGSRPRRDAAFASIQPRKAGSRIAPCFTTSASPEAYSRAGRVARLSVSAMTAAGWWKAPTMFLPSGWLIAVFPPTEESTWASSVVGTWMWGMPRW